MLQTDRQTDRQTNSLTPNTGVCGFFLRVEFANLLRSHGITLTSLVLIISGTIAALLQEIINIYPAINPPVLTAHQVKTRSILDLRRGVLHLGLTIL